MLSVLIRAKNEEKNIERAIRSVQGVADQVVVLDSGSTDKTVELAQKMGAEVFFREWTNYADQINYGVQLCKGEWVFVLDADEELSEELRESVMRALKDPECDVYMVCRRTYYMGKFLKHAWYPEWRVRLFRKGSVKFEGVLHERAVFEGRACKLKGDLYHYSYRSLWDQYSKTINYAMLMAKELHEKGVRFSVAKLMFNPLWAFLKVYVVKGGFLDGMQGFSVAVSSGIYTFLKYLFLWELELKERKGGDLWR